MSPKTLRLFYVVHKWTGLLSGFALFAAFYAGALTMFMAPIGQWQHAQHAAEQAHTVADAQRLLDEVLKRHPEAGNSRLTVTLPDERRPEPQAFFVSRQGFEHTTLAELQAGGASPHSELAELVNELHYALGIPVVGGYFLGIVSLIYGVAIVSGVLIHLPRLSREFLALRPGRNLKRFWLDAHNLIGVVSLPFHLVFAWTGAALALGVTVLLALNPIAFRGQLMTELPQVIGTLPSARAADQPAAMLPIEAWATRASQAANTPEGAGTFTPRFVRIQNAGRANALVEVRGDTPRRVGGTGAVGLNAITGEVLNVQVAGDRDLNHSTLTIFYSLHFGDFGGLGIQLLYAVLGLAGAFLFYSGNLLFIEARRKTRQALQPALTRWMARATVGLCLGFCVAVSATFVATQVLMWWAQHDATLSVSFWERVVCFASWLACVLWAAWRAAPIRAAQELLWAAAATSALAPVAHVLLADIAIGWPIDVGALVLGAGFACLAVISGRRARSEPHFSVWSA